MMANKYEKPVTEGKKPSAKTYLIAIGLGLAVVFVLAVLIKTGVSFLSSLP